MTHGRGMMANYYTKQKVNSCSSTEAALIGIDKKISKTIWMNCFIEKQDFHINDHITFQDNTNVIKQAENVN